MNTLHPCLVHNFFEQFVARSLRSLSEAKKLKMEKSFSIRFSRKYDSHGTSLNLFNMLAQVIWDCVMGDGGCVFDNRSDTSAVQTYPLTDRHFSSF